MAPFLFVGTSADTQSENLAATKRSRQSSCGAFFAVKVCYSCSTRNRWRPSGTARHFLPVEVNFLDSGAPF
jgi:hypothetical protein